MMRRVKILIVDDEEIILAELTDTLTNEGYECVTAASVDAALEIIRNCSDVSLILTDLKMPGKSGEELIQFVEEEFFQEHKFIVMSGYGSSRFKSVDLESGPYKFLSKPVDIDRLIDTVGSVLDN